MIHRNHIDGRAIFDLDSLATDELSFRTIDLARHADVCVRFSRDAHVCSFGSDERFFSEGGGEQGYLAWLEEAVREHPFGHLHVWRGDHIVGQIQMRVRDDPPESGYINLLYLVPEERGGGAGARIHDHALGYLRAGGAKTVWLSVSPTNARAVAYYRKHGWRDLGPRPGAPHVHLMRLDLVPAP